MSRQGMIPPAQRFPAPRGPGAPGGLLPTVLSVLLRQTVLGLLLWSGAAQGREIRLTVSLTGLCAIILLTRRFGILRPTGWATASWEGLLLYIGAACIGNLLRLGFGIAPWWRQLL